MKTRWWPWMLLVLALVPALLIAQPEPFRAPLQSQNENEAIFSNPNTLDPALANTGSDWAVDMNVFQTLFTETGGGQLVPELVSHYAMSGRQITLQIKPVPLVGGGRLSAAIVAGALARTVWKSLNSATARTLLTPIVGYHAVITGKVSFFSGIQVTSQESLTIHLKTPATRAFLRNLANPALAIVPPSNVLRGGTHWQFLNLYGTGGYRLVNWIPNGSLTFERVGKTPGPQRMTLTVYPSLAQAILSFQNQAVNLVPVSATKLSSVPRSLLTHLKSYPMTGTLSLYYQTGAKTISAYPGIRISQWVKQSFRGRLKASLGAKWPGHVPGGKVMTLYVNQNLPQAIALANMLKRLRPHQVTVSAVPPATLKTLAQTGRIGAYIGLFNWFKHSQSTPLVPVTSFWLVDPSVKTAAVFTNGTLNWHSLGFRQ